MIEVRNVVLSDDIADKHFVCNLRRCKGACCEEGDMGAPLTDDEAALLPTIFDDIKPYLTAEGIAEINNKGHTIFEDGFGFVTPTIRGRACVYAVLDEKKVWKCGIERAFLDGKTTFRKPISCHLYPIRVKQYDEFTILNYSRWDICRAACELGDKMGIEIYKFLKEPLIRKFGEDWYKTLVETIEERNK